MNFREDPRIRFKQRALLIGISLFLIWPLGVMAEENGRWILTDVLTGPHKDKTDDCYEEKYQAVEGSVLFSRRHFAGRCNNKSEAMFSTKETWDRPPSKLIPGETIPLRVRTTREVNTEHNNQSHGMSISIDEPTCPCGSACGSFQDIGTARVYNKSNPAIAVIDAAFKVPEGSQGDAIAIRFCTGVGYYTQPGWRYVYEWTAAQDGDDQSVTGPSGGTDGEPAGGRTSGEPADVTRMTLQASRRTVRSGESVSVPIYLINATGVANINFNLTYDPAVVSVIPPVTRGNMMGQALFEGNPGESGLVRVGFATNADLAGTGTVAQLTFSARGRDGARTPIRLEVTTAGGAEGGRPQVATIDGEIVIVGASGGTPGDSDGDGVLTARDAGEALKMSVRLIPVKMSLDMDRDGQVTSTDARLILQKVVGQ